VYTLNVQAKRKNIVLTTEIAADVQEQYAGDDFRIKQILLNLVGNAIKFTDQGTVLIRVSEEAEAADTCILRFEIIDTGIGIIQSAQDRLFAPFTQADGSTTRKFGGTGLGLAISKKLTELMGGSIGMSSVAEKGSTFWFTVPLKRITAAPVPEPTPEEIA
ncbi:MAG: ATP-binding protein, partial [Terriglobales bacterium]